MAHVFISYSREDQERAAAVAALLEQQGLITWWDRKIPPGKTWDQVIGQALDEADCVVVLWTSTSVQSNWVKEEAARGAHRNVLVPVIFDHMESPLGFGRIEAAEFSDWKGGSDHPEASVFLHAVKALVKPESRLPSPHPGMSGGAGQGTAGTDAGRLPWKIFAAGLGALLLLGVTLWIWWPVQQQTHSLEVQIWEVEGDRKSSLLAARSFSGTGDAPAQTLIDSIALWAVERMLPDAGNERRPVEVQLSIPADPGSADIGMSPDSGIPLQTHLYIIQDTGKVRVKSDLNREALALIGQDFVIEIGALGYASVPVRVEWGTAVEKHILLKPITVKLAVEDFVGPQNRIGAALTHALAQQPGLSLFGPDALARLRQEIADSRASIGVHRAAQTAIRDSLGVDFIVGGSYRYDTR